MDHADLHGHTTDGMLNVPCSSTDMKEFVSGGYFSLSNAFFGTDWTKILSGGTVGQWRQEYEKRVEKEVIQSSYFVFQFLLPLLSRIHCTSVVSHVEN